MICLLVARFCLTAIPNAILLAGARTSVLGEKRAMPNKPDRIFRRCDPLAEIINVR
jgi:hypothetical protein